MKTISRIIIAVWCLTLLSMEFYPAYGMDATIFKTEDGSALILSDVKYESGTVILDLLNVRRNKNARNMIVFDPTFNNQIATFSNGWDIEEIGFSEESSNMTQLVIHSNNPNELPESICFRFLDGELVSSPCIIRFGETCDDVVTTPALIESSEQPLIMREVINENILQEPVELTDQLSLSEYELIDYGQAVICLRQNNDREECFVPFCYVPVKVKEDGQAIALFSGLVPVFTCEEHFPLQTIETYNKDITLFSISNLFLSGDSVYFAELKLEIEVDPLGHTNLSNSFAEASELGGKIREIPIALFSMLRATHSTVRLNNTGEYTFPETVDVIPLSLSCEEPFQIELIRIEEIGDIYIYFEYFFTDGNSSIHTPFPWSA